MHSPQLSGIWHSITQHFVVKARSARATKVWFGFDRGEAGCLWDAVLSLWRFPIGRERLCLPQGSAGRSCAHCTAWRAPLALWEVNTRFWRAGAGAGHGDSCSQTCTLLLSCSPPAPTATSSALSFASSQLGIWGCHLAMGTFTCTYLTFAGSQPAQHLLLLSPELSDPPWHPAHPAPPSTSPAVPGQAVLTVSLLNLP